MTVSCLSHLECSLTGEVAPADELHGLSPAGRPWLPRYDLERAAATLTREALVGRRSDLWRYAEVLPVRDPAHRIALGEGWTPIIHAQSLGERFDRPGLLIKDEAQNPTGSFKARGLGMAISRARELGVTEVAIPTAGNAGSAAAAYAAAAGLGCHVFMPADCPRSFELEARAYGARVERVDGLIDDCGRKVRDGVDRYGWFDLSTLKEPYRLEGKKAMGYELAEQLGWRLPDVVIYPTGGGTGLIGMWKAFEEMEAMGLVDPGQRPRMVSVQAEGCCPIVRAFEAGEEHAPRFEDAHTVADGLRVPVAVADFLMLRAIRASSGTAIAVPDAEMLDYARVMASHAGVFPAPEGGATLAAFVRLRDAGWIAEDETALLFNTGTPFKVMELWR
jgi:threonine synthase